MFDFNDSKDTYRETIEESIRFSGKNLDFFTNIKADFLEKIVKKHLPDIKNPKLLDIGCGHGFIHSRLVDSGFLVFGVEMADEVLAMARESHPNVSYQSHDGKNVPHDSSTFDVVIAICVMHHVPPEQWHDFLKEMQRVLKPKGIAVIFEHNPYNPLTRYIVANNALDKGVTLLKKSKLEKMMYQTGFKRVKSRFILFTPFASMFFRYLDSLLGWCPLGAQYYTVAKN